MKLRKVITFAALAMAAGTIASAQGPQANTEWADKSVPLEVYAQFPMISGPQLSPGGKWIATKVRVPNDGVQKLAIMPVKAADGKLEVVASDAVIGADKQGDRRVVGYQWADDDHLIIEFASRDNFAGEWFDNVRYASYNRVTKASVPLWDDKTFAATDLLWVSHSGKPHALIERKVIDSGGRGGYDTERAGNPEVIDVDLDTGKYSTVMAKNPEVAGWIADSDGVVRMGSSSDRETGKVEVLYRDNGNQPMRVIFKGVPDKFNDLSMPSLFVSGGKKAYAYSRNDGYRALYEYDLSTMKLGKKVFGVTGYDIDGASLNPDNTALSSVTVTKGRTERVYFDARLKEIQGVLEEMFGAGNVFIATADRKRETIMFRVSAAGQAETWYIFDTVTGSTQRFAYANDTLKNAQLNPVKMITYPTSDGKKVEAVLTMPRHRVGQKNLPMIIIPHGGPWGVRDDADWDAYGWAQSLAEMGYVVVQPNYRGSGGYGSEWSKASEKAWGYRMQDDLNDAIPYLAGQGIVDAKRVCMFGWSYGGYAASRAAERDGDKYRCTISGAGVHDLVAMQKYDRTYLGIYGSKAYMGSAGNDLVDVSPGLHPEKYSIPILIVQGVRDIRVPVAQARNLVAALKKAGKVEGKDFFYLEQPLNTHNLLREADRIQLMQEVKKFLDRFNPA